MQRNRKRSDVGSNVEDNRVGLLVSKSSRKYKYGMFSSSLYCFFFKKKKKRKMQDSRKAYLFTMLLSDFYARSRECRLGSECHGQAIVEY